MPAGGGSVDRAPDSQRTKREFETGKAQIFFYHTYKYIYIYIYILIYIQYIYSYIYIYTRIYNFCLSTSKTVPFNHLVNALSNKRVNDY